MKRLLSLFTALTIALTLIPSALVPPVQAGTGPWSWSDISSYITHPQKRPIWAMAYSTSGWFYTDGLNMYEGGQLYLFDGHGNSNVTYAVRDAGIRRIDDIVSDGKDSVLFLESVVDLDENFEIVAYRNGGYVNYTDTVQEALDSDEGISSLTGRNGEWMIVTTKGRLFRWYVNATPPRRIDTPSTIGSQSNQFSSKQFQENYLYSTRHGFASIGKTINLRVLPVNSSDWLVLGTGTYDSNDASYIYCYRYDGSSFMKLNCPNAGTETRSITGAISNGRHALIFVHGTDGSNTLLEAFEYTSGSNFQHIERLSATSGNRGPLASIDLRSDENAELIPFGNDWMLVADKRTFRITDTDVYDNGETRDMFVTGANDGDDTTLLGGVISKIGKDDPVDPLTAKLVLIKNDGGTSDGKYSPSSNTGSTNTSGGTRTATKEKTDAGSGIRTWEWLVPPQSRLEPNESIMYGIGAWDADGLKRIQINVNGDGYEKTCDFENRKGNAECTFTIYADSYPENTDIFVNARIEDANGRYTWTEGYTIHNEADRDWYDDWYDHDDDNQNTNDRYNDDADSTIWLSPDRTTLGNNDRIDFNVRAWDKDGIEEIEILLDGNERRTCNGRDSTSNVECAYTIYSSDLSYGDDVRVRALIRDSRGNETYSDSVFITRTDHSDYGNDQSSDDVNIRGWIDGSGDLDPNEVFIYRTEGWAEDGLRKIEIFVDDQLSHGCSYNEARGTMRCNYQIDHDGRTDGSSIRVKAKATDVHGDTDWSDEIRVRFRSPNDPPNNTDTGSGNATNEGSNGTAYRFEVWEYLQPNKTEIAIGDRIRYEVGMWAEKGIKKATVYVNGTETRTCDFYPGTGNQTCWVEIDGYGYQAGTTVTFSALVRDFKGQEKRTTGLSVRIQGNATSTPATPSNTNAGTISVWTNKDAGYRTNDTILVSAKGSDADGIDRIDIHVNGKREARCTKQETCSVNVGPYASSAFVNVSATLYDNLGHMITTGYKQIARIN